METTNWYLEITPRMHCFLKKIESDNTLRCTFDRSSAMKFNSKKDALQFSIDNKIETVFKPFKL